MRLVIFASLLLIGLPASAQIYRCENGNGVVEYSNNAASGKDRNCKPISLPTITTIPAPKLPPPRAGGGAAKSPDGFPKVDGATQKTRDNDRKRILEDELHKEEGRLAELNKEFNGGEPERLGSERNYQKYLDRVQSLKDEIARSKGNIDTLKRELGSVKE